MGDGCSRGSRKAGLSPSWRLLRVFVDELLESFGWPSGRILDLGVTDGAATALGRDGLAIGTKYAEDHGWRVGYRVPMIIASPIMPFQMKAILWKLSRMHDENIHEFTRDMERVFYFPQPVDVKFEGFFADGIHPSEQGYADWAAAMMKYFSTNYKW